MATLKNIKVQSDDDDDDDQPVHNVNNQATPLGMTISRDNRYRWLNRTLMAWFVLVFSIGGIVSDLIINLTLTKITTIFLPIMTWVVGMHFDLKSLNKKKVTTGIPLRE